MSKCISSFQFRLTWHLNPCLDQFFSDSTCLKQRYKIVIRLFTAELTWKKEAFALLLYVLGLQLVAMKWELSSVTDETQSRKVV